MKRLSTICILVCAICLIAISTAPAANASISDWNWISALTRNTFDPFYGETVTGYGEGTTATLIVSVYNNYPGSHPVNISAVKVGLDWGQNYTSTEASMNAPFVLDYHASHIFTIVFTMPNTTSVSNYITHGYTIYAEHVNSTTGPKRIVSSWTSSATGFAIFSTDQADAKTTLDKLEAYPSMSLPFFTAGARELLTESAIARSMGETEYRAGNFASAKTNYQNALNLLQNAYSNETKRWGSFEDAFQGLISGTQSLVVNQGYAWLLFGVAFLLMGIGAIVYLVRKSGTKAS